MTVAGILLTFIAMEQALLLEELKRLFATAIKFDEFEFVNVLIGYNGMGDQRALTHLYESRAYIADMKNQMSSAPNLHTKTRLALHIYCHLFEMDELYNILGNLLRIAIGQQLRYLPELFSGREELMTLTEKFVKLKDLAEQCRFAEFLQGLEDLYSNKMRNAFLHSTYSLIDDDFCIVKGDGIKIGGSSHQSVSIENFLMPLIASAINFIDALFSLIDESKMSYKANKIVQARMPELQPVVILGDAEKGLIGFQTFVGSWIKIKSAYGTEHFVEAMNLRISNHNGPNHDLNEKLEQYVEKLTPFGKDFDSVRDEVIATKDAVLLNNLAMVYYNRANNIAMTAEGKPARQQDAIYKSAKQYYDLSIATNPAFARSYHNMGTALIKQAETNNSLDLKLRLEVLALFDKTISIDKNMFEAWLNSARMVFEIGLDEVDAEKQFSLFQDSIIRYQNAIELYPRDAEAHSSKARVHLKLARMGKDADNNFHAAIDSYQKAMDINNVPDTIFALSAALAEYAEVNEEETKNLLDKSVTLLLEAQQKFGDSSKLNYRLGNKYMVLARTQNEPALFEKAAGYFEQSVKLDASNVWALNNWSNCELVQSINTDNNETSIALVQSAKERLNRVVGLDPTHEMGWYNLGLADIELAKKNVGDKNSLLISSISHLKQANALKTELGAYDLARAYALSGDLPHALDWLKQSQTQIANITEESDFDSLKDLPDFKEFLSSISPAVV